MSIFAHHVEGELGSSTFMLSYRWSHAVPNNHEMIEQLAHTKRKGFFLSTPLQFCKFRGMPLQFT